MYTSLLIAEPTTLSLLVVDTEAMTVPTGSWWIKLVESESHTIDESIMVLSLVVGINVVVVVVVAATAVAVDVVVTGVAAAVGGGSIPF